MSKLVEFGGFEITRSDENRVFELDPSFWINARIGPGAVFIGLSEHAHFDAVSAQPRVENIDRRLDTFITGSLERMVAQQGLAHCWWVRILEANLMWPVSIEIVLRSGLNPSG